MMLFQSRAVQTSWSLEEGRSRVVVPETNDVVFEENNGRLVLVADHLSVPDPLEDQEYGISIRAVKLKKVVQMFQWFEIEDHALHSNPETPSIDHSDHGKRCCLLSSLLLLPDQ